jgi:hypothetical protein
LHQRRIVITLRTQSTEAKLESRIQHEEALTK